MKIKSCLILSLFVFLYCIPSFCGDEKTLSLSIEESIIKALENNLKVAVEVYNPDLADTSVLRAKELFMPRFELTYSTRRDENPSYWWLQGEETVINKYMNYSISLVQQIPTGGNLSLSLNNYKSDTNQAFQLINPRFGSTLQFDFTQPLLKNFGFNVSRREIIIARNNLDISQNQFKSVLQETIYAVQEAYWNLVYAIDNFRVKQQSLQLARDLLAKNKKEVEVGKLAPLEILNAEAVVASREADILQAEALIKRSEDALRNIINLTDKEDVIPIKILPLDKPAFVQESVSLEESIKLALENRPDLMMNRKNIETKELDLTVAKNQMLPGLDLRLSYWSPGISGDRVLYLDNNPFLGVIVGKEKGSASDSLRDAFKFLYKNWTIGLTFSLPLSQVFTKADLVRARMELEQSLLEQKRIKNQIVMEVRDAVREIETNAKRVEAYRIARELAEKRLEAEEKKLNVGLTTNYFVLQFQEELATARSLEIKSLVDYNLSLAKFEKVTGTSLEKRNIKVSSFRLSL